MQQQILARSRSLGMTGQLPGFQGNVPIGLKEILVDSNMTDNKKGTAWMDSLDPHYSQIADEWMKEMTNDFGTDHWWQLDGYFNGGTAPWFKGVHVFFAVGRCVTHHLHQFSQRATFNFFGPWL